MGRCSLSSSGRPRVSLRLLLPNACTPGVRPIVRVRYFAVILQVQVLRGKVTVSVLKMAFGESLVSSLAAHGPHGGNPGSEDEGQLSTIEGGREELDALCGSNVGPGKLQVGGGSDADTDCLLRWSSGC